MQLLSARIRAIPALSRVPRAAARPCLAPRRHAAATLRVRAAFGDGSSGKPGSDVHEDLDALMSKYGFSNGNGTQGSSGKPATRPSAAPSRAGERFVCWQDEGPAADGARSSGSQLGGRPSHTCACMQSRGYQAQKEGAGAGVSTRFCPHACAASRTRATPRAAAHTRKHAPSPKHTRTPPDYTPPRPRAPWPAGPQPLAAAPGNGVFLLLVLNIAAFAADHLLGLRGMQQLYLNHAHPQWWQWVTHAFCHANWNHLSMNLFNLCVFGKLVEETEGSFGVVFTYVACALGALRGCSRRHGLLAPPAATVGSLCMCTQRARGEGTAVAFQARAPAVGTSPVAPAYRAPHAAARTCNP